MNLTLARGALFLVASLLFGALDARCIVQVPPDPVAAAITTEQVQITSGVTLGNVLPLTVTTLVREYVWGPGDGPGGVDELLVQYATDRVKPWWVLQDGGGDVAALCETPLPGAQAVVAGQWTYDAYGSCLTAEVLRPHPLMHCGHKALFFDRLDVGVVATSGDELPRLVPYAHAVYQVRNRAYAPALGRFYQRDPNATAMALIEVSAYHGRGLSAIINAFSMDDQFGDGANLYTYLAANTWSKHDPLGLWISGIGPTDQLMLGFEVGRVAFNLIDRYAGDMEAGAAWAEDWSLNDHLFSEESIRNAERQDALDALHVFADMGESELTYADARAITAAIKAAQLLGRVRSGAMYPTYYAARYAIQKAGAMLQAHHIVEVRVLKLLGKGLNGPAIALTRAQHLVVTNRLRKAIPYGPALKTMTRGQIIAKYVEAYRGLPDLLTKALEILE